MKTKSFTAALLAGGKSSRMEQDKATLSWEGRPLWRRQIELLEQCQPAFLLISGIQGREFEGCPYPVVYDETINEGPLAGLSALLKKCHTDYLLLLAVDMPWIPLEIVQRLLSFQKGVVPRVGDWFIGTAALYPRAVLPYVEEALRSTDPSFQALLRKCLAAGIMDEWVVEEKESSFLKSWNYPIES